MDKNLWPQSIDHSEVVAGSTLLSLVGLTLGRPKAPIGGVSTETTAALRSSAQEMRQILTNESLIPTETQMKKIGWERVAPPAKDVVWKLPPGREVLSRINAYPPALFGKPGLIEENLWRNTDGTVFHADPNANPKQYKLRTEFSLAEMRLATPNVFTSEEVKLANRLAETHNEMKQLSNLETKLAQNSVLHLKDLQPHSIGSYRANRHNLVLDRARNELIAPAEAYTRATRNAWKSVGSLLGSQVLNYHLDRKFFEDDPISIRTTIVDGASPLVAMTRLHWSAKAAVMVGSHLSSRWLDAYSSRK